PKGYQISQYETPVCKGGYIDLPANGAASRRIRLVRIHLEEDAGKNIHAEGASLVDFNRSGVPLVEIVSEPDIRSSAEAGAYLQALRAILKYVGASDGKMEEGSFRCDVNVSVRTRGNETLGTRSEIKNLNSFRFVENAIEHEIDRQSEILEAGGKVRQETHLWDPEREETRPMRSKEFADDYRYFPEPDLPPLIIDAKWIDEVRASMPELPSERRARYVKELGLSDYDAGVLTAERELADYFEAMLPALRNRKAAANWVTTEVLRRVNESGKTLAEAAPPTAESGALLRMVEDGKISLTAAKTAFSEMVKSGTGAQATIDALGLAQVSDEGAIAEACDRVLAEETDNVAQYRAGKQGLLGFFVGKVMKSMGGKANPKVVNEILRKKLGV
ncbi:MAG: Asp-tRNA(Asn)/Glu-tRNA(Gln) amidotransferase subunit GatB, partial [Candidatus Binataceae bacterium]